MAEPMRDEKLLNEVLDIFCGCEFDYWISQGTLLGLVRENRVLPWDNDIDISVWDDEVSKKEIIELMAPKGFLLEFVPGESDCLHFYREGDKNVDIGFYKRSMGLASICWVVPGQTPIAKVGQYLSCLVDSRFSYKDISGRAAMFKKLVFYVFRFLQKVMPTNVQRYFAYVWRSLNSHFFQYRGYSYPVNLLQDITWSEFIGRKMPIPREFESILEITYGKDWRKPVKNFVWHKEAKNLLDQ